MDTRKQKLILLAHLRGIKIEPYYEQGLASVFRENMLLKAMSASLDVDMARELINVESALGASLGTDGAVTVLRRSIDAIERLRYQTEFNYDSETSRMSAMSNIAKVYTALEKSGFLDKLKK